MNVSNAIIASAFDVTDAVLSLYISVIVIGAILSWLVAFGVINMHNRFVQMMSDFIYRATEPVLRPLRRILPPMGGLDLSPLVLILIIIFLQSFLRNLVM